MNTNLKSSRRIASVLLLSVVLAGCASGPMAPSTDLLRQVDTASTRGEHESLAARYDKEAATARAVAAEHRKMAQSYQGMVAGGRGSASMVAHCNAIVRSQESIAVEYQGMAAAHRQLAAQAKP
jgi:PBP1b-binding outer membrane lipoprotein LpoB